MGKLHQYDVTIYYTTKAANAGEALMKTEAAIASRKDYYVEVYDGDEDKHVLDGVREDITIKGVSHED